VEVETVEGRVQVARITTPKGDPRNPLSPDELRQKFMSLTSRVLGEKEADTLLRRVCDLHRLDDIHLLFAGMTAGSSDY